ncbi:MAG: hypothetical protein WA101_01870 [Minisyncoccia bacterium]
MGATRFFKEGTYTQEKCQKSLEEGYSVGFPGSIKPETDQITIPITVKEVREHGNGKIIGFNINKIYYSDESIEKLVKRYTNDIWYDAHGTEAKMNRSKARVELLKIGKDTLKLIAEKIETNIIPPNPDFELFMAYASLLFDIIQKHKLPRPPYNSNIKYGEQDPKVWIKYCQTNG